MTRRRKKAGPNDGVKQRVVGFRLDERCDRRLAELADEHGTTPNLYARGVLSRHLGGAADDQAGAHPATPADTELGAFLHQVRDELKEEAERQGQRLEAVTARLSTLIAHVNALTKKVVEVDGRLVDFLARVEPM